MSKTYLITVATLAAGGLFLIFGFQAKAQQTQPGPSAAFQPQPVSKMAAAFSRPGNSQDYLMNNNTNNWDHIFNSAYTYNTNGQLIQRTGTRVANNQLASRLTYAYDAQGNETEYNFYAWNNNSWVQMAGTKNLRTYNAQGKVTEHIVQNWSISNNTWVNKDKSEFTYDAAGNLLEEIMTAWSGGVWLNIAKLEYIYTNGIITKVSEYNHNNGAWFNNAQKVNITWHNQALMQMAGYTQQFKSGSTFTDYGRTIYTYSGNGSMVTIQEAYNNGGWQKISRESVLYDAQSNFVGQKNDFWVNNNWEINSGSQVDITYNSTNDITQKITRNYNTSTSSYKDYDKTIYSNFQQFVTGVNNDAVSLNAAVYPNPVQNSLTITVSDKKDQPVTATLTDLTGKTVKNQTIAAGIHTTRLSTEALPAGIYLLQLKTESSRQTFKIVKQ